MRIAFADESGIDGSSRCYAIGVLSFDASRLEHFEATFTDLKLAHGVVGEVKWGKVNTSHGMINLALAWLDKILRSRSATFDLIAVNTRLYNLWSEKGANREEAFYKTYTYLLRHIVRRTRAPTEVWIDDRSDSYLKQTEVLETVGNRMLAQLVSTGRLQSVRKVPSSKTPGIQVADLLTGAFTASHRRHLEPNLQINSGKKLAIDRLASMIGWDDLCYDTFPNPKLNIWHFPPIGYRAEPETRDVVIAKRVPYITSADLATARASMSSKRG